MMRSVSVLFAMRYFMISLGRDIESCLNPMISCATEVHDSTKRNLISVKIYHI